MSVKPFKINSSEKLYYNMKDLTILSPEFFYGCKTKPRNIIQKKNIPTTDYVYANLKKNEWNLTNEECKKAQLLVTKEWIDKYFFTTVKNAQVSKKDIDNNEENENLEQINDDIYKNENNIENNDCEIAPPEIYLDDEEKFKDVNGNIIEIETRGEKREDKIFFKVKDVMDGFKMNNLHSHIIDKNSGYNKNIDYKYFFNRVSLRDTLNDTIKKSLYLTYEGMLRVLFVSRNENATVFRKWATNKIFTIQMGSKDEKQKLGTQLLKVDLKTFKAVFDSYVSTFPCIYLLSLGKVKELRDTFNIPNDVNNSSRIRLEDSSTVYKYGFTDDLERRLREHTSDYGKMKNVDISLSLFHMVDNKYISKAETDVKHLFNVFDKSLNVESTDETLNKKRKELVVLNDKEYKQITEHYKLIGLKYIGSTQFLQDKVQELQNEIKIINLNKEIEIQKLTNENEMLKREIQTNIKIHELEKRTLELELKLLKNNI